MYRLNQKHRHTIIQCISIYSRLIDCDRNYILINIYTNHMIIIEYDFKYDDLIIHGRTGKRYRANEIDDNIRTCWFIEAFRKDIEESIKKSNIIHACTKIPEEDQRQLILALNNLFEPEDSGLTKRAN